METVRAVNEINGNGSKPIQLGIRESLTLLYLDLSAHILGGMAEQLASAVGADEPSVELKKSVSHLMDYRARFLAGQTRKIQVVRSMSDVVIGPATPEKVE